MLICKVCVLCPFDLWLVDDVRIKMKIPALAEYFPIILEEVVTRKYHIIRTMQRSVYY